MFSAILELNTEEECRQFFYDLCTPGEVADFCDRWRIAEMLIKDVPYREIASEIGVSTTTVGRVARFLYDGNNGYEMVLKRQGKL